MTDPTLFQYCQKIIIFRNNDSEVLLARRKGELDYDAIYSLIGGKLETADGGIIEGLQREKNEELGSGVKLRALPFLSWNTYFIKKDGNHMVLPHCYAAYVSGEITLSDEYSDYRWVNINQLHNFEPKIANIPEAVRQVLQLKAGASEANYIEI